LAENLISPESFAQTFCQDLDLPLTHVENIVNMIRAQLEEHSGVVGVDVNDGDKEPDCRVILRV
jgi:chromatin structure-remodeling complex subunit SFH1